MKHQKLVLLSNGDSFSVNCLFGNIVINETKVNNKKCYTIHPYTDNKYTLTLFKKYSDNYRKVEDITYKTPQDALNAIEKVCNEYYNNEIKFWFH